MLFAIHMDICFSSRLCPTRHSCLVSRIISLSYLEVCVCTFIHVCVGGGGKHACVNAYFV